MAMTQKLKREAYRLWKSQKTDSQVGVIAFDKDGHPVLRLFPGCVENMAKRYQDRKRREAGE